MAPIRAAVAQVVADVGRSWVQLTRIRKTVAVLATIGMTGLAVALALAVGVPAVLVILGGSLQIAGVLVVLWEIGGDFKEAEELYYAESDVDRPIATRSIRVREGTSAFSRRYPGAEVAGAMRRSQQSLVDALNSVAGELHQDAVEGDNDLLDYIKRILIGKLGLRLGGVGLLLAGIVLITVGSVLGIQ